MNRKGRLRDLERKRADNAKITLIFRDATEKKLTFKTGNEKLDWLLRLWDDPHGPDAQEVRRAVGSRESSGSQFLGLAQSLLLSTVELNNGPMMDDEDCAELAETERLEALEATAGEQADGREVQ